MQAIPSNIKDAIQNNPIPIRVKSTWGINYGEYQMAILVTSIHPLEGWTKKVYPNQITQPQHSNLEALRTELRPIIEFNQSDDEDSFIVEFLDTKELHLDFIRLNNNQKLKNVQVPGLKRAMTVPLPVPKNQNKWAPLPQNFRWKKVYASIWKAPVPQKWNQTAWLLIRKSLPLGSYASRHNLDWYINCSSCQKLETHSHLFLTCPLAQFCWAWARRKWKLLTGRSFRLSLPILISLGSTNPTKGGQHLDYIWVCLHRCVTQAIWSTRCGHVFGHLPWNTEILLHQLNSNLTLLVSLYSFIPKHKSNLAKLL
jgi:hypothetical protein